MPVTEIRVAHSPDSDDAFMFYGLASGKLDTGDLRFIHILEDIETLNRKALAGEYEITAISFHAYAHLYARYALLPHGASMGDRYGPLVVARRPLGPEELSLGTIAVPGTLTTAFLALRLFLPDFQYRVLPFDRILEAVVTGAVDAGLLIHEGQLTYASLGLHKVLDLGEWWDQQTNLPLPLGGNAIRKDLGAGLISRVSRLLKDSIAYGLDHRQEALAHSLKFARGLSEALADRFVGMYVNELTLDYGDRGRRAVHRLFEMAHRKGLLPPVPVEFVD
ncbi:MAG: ABC transporter substrate-binding protein [Acidobacteria bacterium]|nr:ABC transporter substrate-binding protein [Acidobacteriota bacterium]